MPVKPTILKRVAACRSRLFRVEEVHLQFSNGESRVFERLAGGGVPAVMVAAVDERGYVLLVEEYGAGIDNYHWSLPKGAVDEGEQLEAAANRELKEEGGYGARRLTRLKCMSQAPNHQQSWTQLLLAEDLYEESLPGDEPEPMARLWLPLSELDEWVARNDISEARSIAALYLVRAHYQGLGFSPAG